MRDPQLFAHDAGNEKSATLAARIWEIFGFGTQYTWILCMIFGTNAFKNVESAEWIGQVKLVIIAGFAFAYFILFCFHKKAVFNFPNRPLILSAGMAGTLGTILIIFPIASSNYLTLAVAAILTGMSSAILMTGGNKVWSELRSERVMVHLTTSALVSSVLYYVLLALPSLVSLTIVCLLPTIGGFILSFTKKNKPRPPSFRRIDPTNKWTTLRVLTFVTCFSFTMGVMLGSTRTNVSIVELFTFSGVLMIGALCASALAFFCAVRLAPSTVLVYLDRLSIPSMVIGCIIVIVVPDEFTSIGCACIMAGFILSDLFMWLLNAELVSRSGRSSFEVLARSCLVEWAALLFGFLVAGFLNTLSYPVQGMIGTRWLYAICAIVLVVVGNFIFTSAEAVRMIEAHEGAKGGELLTVACGILAEQYGLSQRESEVMLLLANGRSVPYIQTKLTLSQSTVKTHVRNIYRKLEIDGKQSLIDLVETTAQRHS